ncbi:MAG: DNA polymerase III subunit delta [Actinomycetota bacterium]|nr:DNA polymerase III subunit delta [Actinomycetota bacterium]MDQ3648355.1 DNA polymerase III subunit delta [Actinomycetota bacterium]
MAELKPLYLVCGDDDVKVDSWRARVRARAEAERGPGGLQSFDAKLTPPERVAGALAELTFETGTRYLLVDDAGAWKAGQLESLARALAQPVPDTVLVLVVRGKALKGLTKIVEAAGGECREYPAPKPWELPRWAAERARELGLSLDKETARALVAAAGPGQQRVTRELEKLGVALHPRAAVTAEDVAEHVSGSAAPRAYDLADAVAAGDQRGTVALGEELIASGERPAGLVFPIVRSLRQVHGAARLLESGASEKQAAGQLGVPPWLAKKTLAKARKADRAALERALCVFADLELELRGGGGDLDDDSAFSLALARAAS